MNPTPLTVITPSYNQAPFIRRTIESVISQGVPGVQYLVARAPWLDGQLFAPLDALRGAGLPVVIVEEDADGVLASADAVVTASGTATVQTALHQRPMVVVYRLAPLTYAMAMVILVVSVILIFADIVAPVQLS